jgi:hypothetical protein
MTTRIMTIRTALLLLTTALAFAGAHAQTAKKKPAAPKAVPVAAAPLPPASTEQIAAASLALYGEYACEFKQTISVTPDAKHEGYADVKFGKHSYVMKPVLSSTGALRFEDVQGETLLLQIRYKSMLMDVKQGHRLVDECVHEKQLAARKADEAVVAAAQAASAAAAAAQAAASAASAAADAAAAAASAAASAPR